MQQQASLQQQCLQQQSLQPLSSPKRTTRLHVPVVIAYARQAQRCGELLNRHGVFEVLHSSFAFSRPASHCKLHACCVSLKGGVPACSPG